MVVGIWVKADTKIRQIAGQTHSLESSVKCPLRNRIIGKRIQHFRWDTFSGSKVNYRNLTAIYAVAKQQYLKIRRFGILVHTALGEINTAECFNINFQISHGVSFQKRDSAKLRRPPGLLCIQIRQGNPHPHRLQNHLPHGSFHQEAHHHESSGDCSDRRQCPCCRWN